MHAATSSGWVSSSSLTRCRFFAPPFLSSTVCLISLRWLISCSPSQS
jgi:hypothetical protein